MRQAQITVLERLRDFEQDFDTEPFETSWAAEATLFVIKHESAHANDYLEIVPQISGDGINWYDADEESLIVRGDDPGGFLALSHFAGAVRFRCRMSHGARFKLTVQLHLKE